MSRKNGFSQPRNCEMIFGASMGLLLICIYYIIITPILKRPVQILLSIFYALLVLGTIIFAVICAYIDPGEGIPSCERIKYCTICDKNVSYNSKHCGQCNRCVAAFDHHCSWINNCVGYKNYKQFFAAIIFLEGFLSFQLGSSIYVIYSLSNTAGNLNTIFNNALVYTMMSISALITCFLCVSNGILICFHIYLKLKNITTYEFIVKRRKNSSKVSHRADIQKYYEPYVSISKSFSVELVRAPNLLDKTNISLNANL